MTLHLVAASSIALAAGSYASRRLPRPLRTFALLAVAVAYWSLPLLHGRDDPLLAQSLCCILSMSAFKALALALGRGCLAKPDLDLWTFLGVMLLPVIPLQSAPERSKRGAIALQKVRSGLMKLLGFAGLVVSALWATHRVERLAASPSASPLALLAAPWLLLACHWAGGVALMLEVDGCGDLTDAVALVGFGIAAEPHFDRVWLSSCFAELWAKRWNLTVSSVLKAALYDPAMEGRLFAEDVGPSSTAPASAAPSAAAATPADSSSSTPFQAPATPLAAAVAAAPATADARPSHADMAAWAAAAGADAASTAPADAYTTTVAAGGAVGANGSSCAQPRPDTSPAPSQRSLSDAGSGSLSSSAMPSEWSAGRSTCSTHVDTAARTHSGGGDSCFQRDSVTSAEQAAAGAAGAPEGAAVKDEAAAHAGGNELRRRRRHQHHRSATEPAHGPDNCANAAPTAPPTVSSSPPPPPAPPSIARSSVSSSRGGGGGGSGDLRLRRFLAGLLTFFASGVWHELVAFTMTGRTTGGSWLLLFTLQAVILAVESELRKATRRAGIRVPLWAARVMTLLLFMNMLSLLWYPPMRSTGMIDALVAQGDRAAAAAAAAAARLEAALLPAVAAVMPAAGGGAAGGVRAWLLSAVTAS